MEIYQVRAFVTVAKLGSITRAAEILHVTQPAVTAQIKALEEELGVALFDRKPGRIAVTRAGETLLPQAETLLDAASGLQGQARELQGEITGSFLLGTVADPEALRLGSFLGAMVQALPLLDALLVALDADNPDAAEPLLLALAQLLPPASLELVRSTLTDFDFRGAEVATQQLQQSLQTPHQT